MSPAAGREGAVAGVGSRRGRLARTALRLLIALPLWLLLLVLLLQWGMYEDPLLHPLRLWPPLLVGLVPSLLLPRWPDQPRWLPLAWFVPGFELAVGLLCLPALFLASLPVVWLPLATLVLLAALCWAARRRTWILLRLGPLRVTPVLPWVLWTLLASLLFFEAEHAGAGSVFCGDLERPGVRRIHHRAANAADGPGLEPWKAQHHSLLKSGGQLLATVRGPAHEHGVLVVDLAPPHRHRFLSTGACWPGALFQRDSHDTTSFICVDASSELFLGELDLDREAVGPLAPLGLRTEGAAKVTLPDGAGGRLVLTELGGLAIHVRPDRSVISTTIPAAAGGKLYQVYDAARDSGRGRLYLTDPMRGSILSCDETRLAGCQEALSTIVSPWGLCFDEVRDRLLVGLGWPLLGRVRALAGEDLALQREQWFLPIIRELDLDPGTGLVAASASFQGTIRLLDDETLDEVDRIDLGAMVRGVTLDRERSLLYASSTCGIYEIDLKRWQR